MTAQAIAALECSPSFANPDEAVEGLQPDEPLYCLSEGRLSDRIQAFKWSFPGDIAYAVKCNPNPLLLQQLADGGIGAFDVASGNEVTLIRSLVPGATLFFDHPIKSRSDLRLADKAGVEVYTIDHPAELEKMLECIEGRRAKVQIRIATEDSSRGSGRKFGAPARDAVALLQEAVNLGFEVGLGFHLGTQCRDASRFVQAFEVLAEVSRQAGISPSWINCGGGFPSTGGSFAQLRPHLTAIRDAWFKESAFRNCRLLCEPGRALVEDAVTLVLRVRLRKGSVLYINDGRFGAIGTSCCGAGRSYSARAIGHPPGAPLAEFTLYGPTCDPTDIWPVTLMLSRDICEGDWVAIANMGAYASAVGTEFNGMATGTYAIVA